MLDAAEKQIVKYLGRDPETCLWLLETLRTMIESIPTKQGKCYIPSHIRWSELYALELEGIYDSLRNSTPRQKGMYDKLIVHEESGRVFRLGYSY
jgi:hypothetical protein